MGNTLIISNCSVFGSFCTAGRLLSPPARSCFYFPLDKSIACDKIPIRVKTKSHIEYPMQLTGNGDSHVCPSGKVTGDILWRCSVAPLGYGGLSFKWIATTISRTNKRAAIPSKLDPNS